MAGRSENFEENARVTLIPEPGGRIAGHWGTGQGIIVHASKGKPTPTPSTQQPGYFRGPIFHEVHWNADVHNVVMRKLINETHNIFMDLQELPDSGGTARRASLIKVSRQYRSIVRAAIMDCEKTGAKELVPGAKSGSQCDLLKVIEMVWHLCEILFIETLPGGTVLHHLLQWVQGEQTENLIRDVLQCSPPNESPSYWPAVYSLVLQGRTSDARELLTQNSERQAGEYDLFESMDELLHKMPTYQSFRGQTAAEFMMKWNHWQQECKYRLESEAFASNPDLQIICMILSGDEEVFERLRDLCPTWYQTMVYKLLYCNPAVKSFDLQYHTQSCIDAVCGNSQLGHMDRVLLAAFEFDVHAVIKESSECFGNWWFVAHLTDLLHHCGQLDSHQITQGMGLREFLLLEYASSLMSNHSLWRVAADYFIHCPQSGRAYLEEYLEHLPLETEKKAMKVLRLCEDLSFPTQAQSICRTMSMKALKNGRLGSALAWCLRSKDSAFAAFISDRFLAEYSKSGGFSNVDLIDSLGSAMLLSDRLTFLGKYREFHKVYEESNFHQAAQLLISLLTSKLAPKRLWLTLLTDALPLLEHDQVIFSSSQTYELMHCLEEVRLSFRSDDYLARSSHDQETSGRDGMSFSMQTDQPVKAQEDGGEDKLGLMRLALARNLARSILKEGQA